MRIVALALVAALGCGADRASSITVVAAAADDPTPVATAPATGGQLPVDRALVAIRETAHRVMSARCGECHESHRPTAKPAALAIFDLDHADWPARFDDHRFVAGLGRFGNATAEDRAAFVAFRDAELAARSEQAAGRR